MIIKLLLIVVAFGAVLAAVRGDTWDAKARKLKKITFTGWVAIALGFLAAAFSIAKEIQDDTTSAKAAMLAKERNDDLKSELDKAGSQIEILRSELFDAQKSSADRQSDATEKIVEMATSLEKQRNELREMQISADKASARYNNIHAAIVAAFNTIKIHNGSLTTRVEFIPDVSMELKKEMISALDATQAEFDEHEAELLKIVDEIKKEFEVNTDDVFQKAG